MDEKTSTSPEVEADIERTPVEPVEQEGLEQLISQLDKTRAVLGEWSLQAQCLDADPEAFFPERGGNTRDAKRVCAKCPVARECLAYALANEVRFGIWGGLSERERRMKRRELQIKAS